MRPILVVAAVLTWTLAQAGVAGSARAQALTKAPILTKPAQAEYPPRALADRVEARVVLALDLDVSGKVTAVSPVRVSTAAEAGSRLAGAVSSTIADYGFVAAAAAAARTLEFEPAEAGDGNPVPVRITYAFNFKLPPPPPPPDERRAATSTRAPAPSAAPGVRNFGGVIRARGTRALVAGAVVTVFRGEGERASGFEATTDTEGRFQFLDLPPGTWKVEAEADGYYPFRTSEEVRAGEALDVAYYVEKGSYNRFDVTVEAPRPKKEVTRRTLTMEEVVKVPGTLNDPVLVVENLPGVARATFGTGDVIVRGSSPRDTALFIDGIDVPLIFHFGGLRSVVPAEVLESLDFFPGNFSVQYGDALGGIVDAHTKHLQPDQVHASIDVSLLDTSLYVEVPIGKTAAIALAGRRSYADAILNAVVSSDSIGFSTAPRYYDYQVLGRWRPTPAHDLRLLLLGSDDKVVLLFKNPAAIDVQLQSGSLSAATAFDRLALEYTFAPTSGWGGNFRNVLRATVGRDDIGSQLGAQFFFNLASKNVQLRDIASYTVLPALTLAAGVDSTYYLSDIGIRLPRPPKEGQVTMNQDVNDTLTTNLHNAGAWYFAPFAEAEVKPIPHLTLVPGLRFAYADPPNQHHAAFDPRLVARYELSAEWVVKGGVGLFHQIPQPDETDPIFGNPDLGPEHAVHYSVGAEWRPLGYLSLDGTLFYKALGDLVSPTSAVVTRDGKQVPEVYDNNGVGRVYGFELYVKHELSSHLRGWLSYTLSRSERKDSGATSYRLFQYDQTHIFALILSYQFPENWELGLRMRVVSGNPVTPVIGGVLNSDLDMYSRIPGAVYSARLPAFQQLDLRLDKTWVWDVWTLSAYFSLVNAYNHGNVESLVYNYDFSKSKGQTGFPIYPILGIRAAL